MIPVWLVIILLAINVVTFFMYGKDKALAQAGKWRISEKKLLILALFGGSLGALAGMKVFHHKTRHKKFTILVPVFLVFHVLLLIYIFPSAFGQV